MLYFKKVELSPDEKKQLEKAMRKSALKRLSSLDFKSAIMDIGTDKLFLGFEDRTSVKFTRLRTSFERYFPKIIVEFPKSDLENEYKFRYSLPSTIVFLGGSILFLLITLAALANRTSYENIITGCVPIGVFILLTRLELRILRKRIKKAVELQLQPSN